MSVEVETDPVKLREIVRFLRFRETMDRRRIKRLRSGLHRALKYIGALPEDFENGAGTELYNSLMDVYVHSGDGRSTKDPKRGLP